MNPADSNMPQPAAQQDIDPFARLGSSAKAVEPAFSARLHEQLISQLAAPKQPRPQAVWPAGAPASVGLARPSQRQPSASWSSYAAVAACVLVLAVAGMLWPESADRSTAPTIAAARSTAGENSGIAQTAPQPGDPAAAALPPSRPDHENLTAALNYLLTLGKTTSVGKAAKAAKRGNTLDREAPWLHPSVSTETLAFELDQRRLQQLTDALFAMD